MDPRSAYDARWKAATEAARSYLAEVERLEGVHREAAANASIARNAVTEAEKTVQQVEAIFKEVNPGDEVALLDADRKRHLARLRFELIVRPAAALRRALPPRLPPRQKKERAHDLS